MAWVKLDDQFPLNSKIRALSVEARYLYVTSLCWCAMQMNDGTFPASDLQAVAALAGVPLCVVEQLTPTFLHPEGFDCEACAEVGQVTPVPSEHVSVHCFLERNDSRAKTEERRRKDRERKRPDPDSAKDSVRNPDGTPAPRNPSVPSRPVLTSSPTSSRPGNSRSDPELSTDDDGQPRAVPDAVWQRYAERKLDLELKAGRVKPGANHTKWKQTTRRNARIEHDDKAERWHREFDVSPDQLAAALIANQAPQAHYRRKDPMTVSHRGRTDG